MIIISKESMMQTNEIQDLYEISQAIAFRPDYVQGGGGNTSVKSTDGKMAIKASGFELRDLTLSTGYTLVKGALISEYLKLSRGLSLAEAEKESAAFILRNLVHFTDSSPLRPSMETGFHSLLDTYVIHSHSVYSNIINCATNGEDILNAIFDDPANPVLFIPYCNPGFELSLQIKEARLRHGQTHGKNVDIIFLQNHGLIVTSNTKEGAIDLHEAVNEKIRKHLKITGSYPTIAISNESEGVFKSNTPYLKQNFLKYAPDQSFFDRVLFPDQTVFFNNNFNFTDDLSNKINVDVKSGIVTYCTNAKEATVIEETLTAYFYILEHLEKLNLSPKFINQADIDKINNMESEKYRKDLMK